MCDVNVCASGASHDVASRGVVASGSLHVFIVDVVHVRVNDQHLGVVSSWWYLGRAPRGLSLFWLWWYVVCRGVAWRASWLALRRCGAPRANMNVVMRVGVVRLTHPAA